MRHTAVMFKVRNKSALKMYFRCVLRCARDHRPFLVKPPILSGFLFTRLKFFTFFIQFTRSFSLKILKMCILYYINIILIRVISLRVISSFFGPKTRHTVVMFKVCNNIEIYDFL